MEVMEVLAVAVAGAVAEEPAALAETVWQLSAFTFEV
jgi:hypothetical protein